MTTTTHIGGIRAVSIPVTDQDAALRFYVETLGFTGLRDAPTPRRPTTPSRPLGSTSATCCMAGVPPMFGFRDPDGNAFSVTE